MKLVKSIWQQLHFCEWGAHRKKGNWSTKFD